MNSQDSQRTQDQNQDEFSPSDGTFKHKFCSPHMEEFSKFLKTVPEKVLRDELTTYQQRMVAQSLWEACNYKGKPTPGQFKDVEPKRNYLEWVLRIDHERQWREALKKR